MPDLNPEVLKPDSGYMSVGIADVDGFPMSVQKQALHAIVVALPQVVGRRSVICLGPGIDPIAVSV